MGEVIYGRSWSLPLPFDRPPLSQNNRYRHWSQQARIVRNVKDATGWQARAAKLPKLDRCRVELHYWPQVKRRRDRDNYAPTIKAAVDGLVAVGVLEDDDSEHVTEHQVVFHREARDVPSGSRVRLVVEELTADA